MAHDLDVTKKKIDTSLSALVGSDPEVDYELGVFFGSKFDELTGDGRKKISSLLSKNPTFAWSLGRGAGWKFKKFPWKVRNWILTLADHDMYFAEGLGHSLSRHIRKLIAADSLGPILEFAEKHPTFAFELAYDLGYYFDILPFETKERLYQIAAKNDKFAFRVGESVGGIYEKLETRDKDDVMNFVRKNVYFSKGFSKHSDKNL